MAEMKTVDILKNAILLEVKGRKLYEAVAEKTGSDALKEIFNMLVKEEQGHEELLRKQLVLVSNGKQFNAEGLDDIDVPIVDPILTGKIKDEISAASYEAAAISAALEFEKNAVKNYGEKETAASSPDEKKLFGWLVKWETEHMQMLARLEDDLKEQIWYDNNFWPLD